MTPKSEHCQLCGMQMEFKGNKKVSTASYSIFECEHCNKQVAKPDY